jgi:hypothetical protein
LLVVIKHKASVVVASFELAFLAYLTPPSPQLSSVVVQLRSAHNDPSEVKNMVGNLPRLGLIEAIGKRYAAIHELNQMVKDELRQR